MSPPICPYCNAEAELRDSAVVYGKSYGRIWLCSNWPECDAYVGVHQGTEEPLGTLANAELREWRKATMTKATQLELIFEQPGNQSPEHFYLAYQARRYLAEFAWITGAEVMVSLPQSDPILARMKVYPHRIVDVFGIGRLHDQLSRTQAPSLTEPGRELVSTSIEVKISRGDFIRGFTDNAGDFNYLAAPRGLVKCKELPPHVGLLTWGDYKSAWSPRTSWAMRMARRAKRIGAPLLGGDAGDDAIASANATEFRNRTRCAIGNPFRGDGE